MNWLNIETATLDSERFVGSEPTARGTWLCLLRFCAGQENGGTIKACATWADRKWQQLARVTQAEVKADSTLWWWVGDDLVLWAYPSDKEAEVREKRERARTNGKLGGRPISVSPAPKPQTKVGSQQEPTLVNSAKAEGNGMEGKGMRREVDLLLEAEQARAALVDLGPTQFETVWALYPKKSGKREAQRHIEAAIKARGFEQIKSAVTAYAQAVARWPVDERKFIPDPVRWFKRGHYDDDPGTWARLAPGHAAPPPPRVAISEPKGWREFAREEFNQPVFLDPSSERYAHSWAGLDRATQQLITERMGASVIFRQPKQIAR